MKQSVSADEFETAYDTYSAAVYRLALVYLEEFNQVGMEDRYTAAADILDQMLETFPYTSEEGAETALLRTYERKWDIIDGDLHYKFNLKVWVSREEDAVLMRSIQSYKEEVS